MKFLNKMKNKIIKLFIILKLKMKIMKTKYQHKIQNK